MQMTLDYQSIDLQHDTSETKITLCHLEIGSQVIHLRGILDCIWHYNIQDNRVVPDTDFAGYPANNFAGYRISG